MSGHVWSIPGSDFSFLHGSFLYSGPVVTQVGLGTTERKGSGLVWMDGSPPPPLDKASLQEELVQATAYFLLDLIGFVSLVCLIDPQRGSTDRQGGGFRPARAASEFRGTSSLPQSAPLPERRLENKGV